MQPPALHKQFRPFLRVLSVFTVYDMNEFSLFMTWMIFFWTNISIYLLRQEYIWHFQFKIFEYFAMHFYCSFAMHFYCSNSESLGVGPFWTMEPTFEQTWYRANGSILQTQMRASEGSGSEEEIFFIIFYVFLCFKPRMLWAGHFKTFIWAYLESTTGNTTKANLKHLRQVILKKISEYFSMYFYGSNPWPPRAGPFWTLRPPFEQLGFGQLGNATYQISSI